MTASVFATYTPTAYPHTYNGTLTIGTLCGGTPTDPKKAEGFIKSKVTAADTLIQQAVAEMMIERGITADQAAEEVAMNRNLNGFKRDAEGLYIEGRQLKAGIKEAANVRWPNGRWSVDKDGKIRLLLKTDDTRTSGKATRSFVAEHIFVLEDRLHLGVQEPTGINQRFVHTFRGSGIQYEEFVEDAVINFTVTTDARFTDEQWALLWLTGEQQGIGATRSQGFGRYSVTRWEKM